MEEQKNILEQLQELEEIDQAEQLVVDNAITFEINKGEGLNYRVRMPTLKEKIEINKNRLIELKNLQTSGFLYEKQLKDELKNKQGIDIYQMDASLLNIEEEIHKLQLKLAPEINEESRNVLRAAIYEKMLAKAELIAKKQGYLESSIESQLMELMVTHFAALVFENKKDEVWTRVFKTYDEFLNSTETKVVNAAMEMTYKLLF